MEKYGIYVANKYNFQYLKIYPSICDLLERIVYVGGGENNGTGRDGDEILEAVSGGGGGGGREGVLARLILCTLTVN